MTNNIIISSALHLLLIIITAFSLPFLAKKPLDLPPIVSIELIQITDKTSIPYAPKAKKIIEKVKEKAIQQGHEPLVINGVERSVVAVSGKVNDDHRAVMKLLPNVSRVIPVGKPYKLASKNYKKENSIIQIQNL